MELSAMVDALLKIFEEQTPLPQTGTHLTVSRTVSLLAVLYEKARNAVEFRAEHLVRRAAIERILKRRLLINGSSQTLGENLVIELLWARYVDSALVDDAKIKEIQQIIERYLSLHHYISTKSKINGELWDIIMGIASSEIDETIISAKRRNALIDFVYQVIRPKVLITEPDEKLVNLDTYIATERAYAQSDDPLIAFHLLKIISPQWFEKTSFTDEETENFLQNVNLVKKNLRDPRIDQIYRFTRRQIPPFLLIRDFMMEHGEKARAIIENPKEFEQKLSEVASERYKEIHARVNRAVVRSIIYIFLTKMIFALALEAPFDLVIAKKISYLSLIINTLFPPVLMFLVAGFFSVPGADNTKRLVERIKKIIYHYEHLQEETDALRSNPRVRRPILTAVFSIFYLVTFALSYGLITFLLTRLNFNLASQIIFVFFVALVSFFAYRIRQSAKEYEIIDRQGALEPIIDLFFLPILQAGQFLSREIAKLNIFIIFFDFILEAPLKVIFEVVEEWIRFIRTKKEEII